MVYGYHRQGERDAVPQAVCEFLLQGIEQVLLVEDAGQTIPRGRLVDAALILFIQLILQRKLEDRVGADLNLVPVLEWRHLHAAAVEESAVGGTQVHQPESSDAIREHLR